MITDQQREHMERGRKGVRGAGSDLATLDEHRQALEEMRNHKRQEPDRPRPEQSAPAAKSRKAERKQASTGSGGCPHAVIRWVALRNPGGKPWAQQYAIRQLHCGRAAGHPVDTLPHYAAGEEWR